MKFPPPAADEILERISLRYRASLPEPSGQFGGAPRDRLKRVRYAPDEFEDDISKLLDTVFPFSRISGPRLFSAARRLTHSLGIEVDNILHLRQNEIDHIVVIEAKKQVVEITQGKWRIQYDSGPKPADQQIENHIRTLWEYLEPFSRAGEVRFTGIVCSVDARVKHHRKVGVRNSPLHLVSVGDLLPLLDQLFNFSSSKGKPTTQVLRTSQSAFLGLLRMSLPIEELGHPELTSAIRYVERCRRSLDQTLFNDFRPTRERWAINGSAGMGKSVLLAYAAVVFASGFELTVTMGDAFTMKADKTFERIGYSPGSERPEVSVLAMSAKQLENLKGWVDFFVETFKRGDESGGFRLRQPTFILCRDAASIAAQASRCSVMLVDEAHDLPGYAAHEIADAHQKRGFFLVVACDRHQKLRLSGSDSRILDGVSFQNKCHRLKQIYRNPAPAYILSLAIMFRWFARQGPKVLPNASELKESFGLEVTEGSDNNIELSIRNDAHPANSWCHTVATYPSAEAAFEAISRERLGHEEVLWVRFCEEDPDFDYEKLRMFTYHNCRSDEAYKISDKYVKGQEYPVVVIEGFPSFMDSFDASVDEENKMWAFRREVYLSASRATCFLYFICNTHAVATPEKSRIKEEIEEAVRSLAMPDDTTTSAARTWKIRIQRTGVTRQMDIFDDTADDDRPVGSPLGEGPSAAPISIVPDEGTAPRKPSPIIPPRQTHEIVVRLSLPVTPKQLAEAVGAKPFEIIKSLMDQNIFANLNSPLGDVALVQKICKRYQAMFEVVELENAAQRNGQSSIPEIPKPAEKVSAFKRSITVTEPVMIAHLASLLKISTKEAGRAAGMKGYLPEPDAVLDMRTVRVIAAKNGFGVEIEKAKQLAANT